MSWVRIPPEAAHFSLEKRVVSGVVVLLCWLSRLIVCMYAYMCVYVCICMNICIIYVWVTLAGRLRNVGAYALIGERHRVPESEHGVYAGPCEYRGNESALSMHDMCK